MDTYAAATKSQNKTELFFVPKQPNYKIIPVHRPDHQLLAQPHP